jgi:hypothetical protein
MQHTDNQYVPIIKEPKALDFDVLEELQQIAFSQIIAKTGTGYLFTAPYYRWKYSAPAGDAKVALIYDDADLVAINAMYPLDLLVQGERIRAWQSCDTAIHPRSRLKGYFVQCINALKEKIGDEAVFFGYPNHTSKPGLAKCGWTHHSNVRTWIRLLPSIKMTEFRFIEPIEHFATEHDIFFKEFATVHHKKVMLERSSTYMNWRYKYHPFHQYEIFGWYESNYLQGIIVLRKAKISGRELAIVMEVLAFSASVERQLLAFAASWGKAHQARFTLVLNNTTHITTGMLSAYVPVPMWMLPKRQILMGTTTDNARANLAWSMPWYIQIGDWDGF